MLTLAQIMLKATAGGGGMGLQVCRDEEQVRNSFATIVSRGETLFKNAGVFLERYYAESRHIEVQVFGNGLGDVITFFERECSIQRRHQKVVEECPSPFVEARPGQSFAVAAATVTSQLTENTEDMRERLGAAACKLAASVNYKSAGTVEFLVDDVTGDYFFLEMNTRLQVEHGITEMCYDVDLVELMLKQADAELAGRGGIDPGTLKSLQPSKPNGVAIELRVYAENPARDYAPAPGILQECSWKEGPGIRIDTWVARGTKISAYYGKILWIC